MDSIVGYTGFVGSNITAKHKFDSLYNSKNIEEAFGTNPDLLVYSGVPAEKFTANKFPEKDFEIIQTAFENIKKINPKKLVLISTIDVYNQPYDVDENTEINSEDLLPYGKNRYNLESMVRTEFPDALICRLPALFGINLKKNFLYDMINVIPGLLNESKFNELADQSDIIKNSYESRGDGFFKLSNDIDANELKTEFNKIGFSAIYFTDSRAKFDFYNLENLWNHIDIALNNDIKLLNLAVEPLDVMHIYNECTGSNFKNEIADIPPLYDFQTIHAELFGGKNGYIFDKNQVMSDIIKLYNQGK